MSPSFDATPLSPKVHLGTVDLPSGVLMVLDPGMGRYWKHDEVPPNWKSGVEVDFAITGRDAEAAGRAFERQFDPGFVFDIPEEGIAPLTALFEELRQKEGHEAALVPMESRMPHLQRARSALAAGDGLGIAQYAGMWAVVAGGFPQGTRLSVEATPMPPGEFAGRWQRIELTDESANVNENTKLTSREVEGVMVDYGQFLFSDLDAFGEFRMWHSLDGLGDYVIWGVDAPALAAELQAPELTGGEYGWKDLPLDELKAHVRPVAKAIEDRKLRVNQDYRPHCNLEVLNAQVRRGHPHAGTLTLADSSVVGMDNSWGDGIFAVTRHTDPAGRVVRVTMELATEKRCRMLHEVIQRSRIAFVSKSVTRDAEPLRFGERDDPRAHNDSGWFFHSGVESDEEANDPNNYVRMTLGRVIDETPGLEMCLDLPSGSLIRWEDGKFVVEEQE
jgi:hypothetical protein